MTRGPIAAAYSVSRFHVSSSPAKNAPGAGRMHHMYVERIHSREVHVGQRIVLVHGTDQTGLCFQQTPDDRPGWAYNLADLGWEVYVVDQVARGRSPYDPEAHGTLSRWSIQDVEALFTGGEAHLRYPQAARHTRWPGGAGIPGNAAFEAFLASQVFSISDLVLAEELNVSALETLLDKIGSAVLLTHSQASVYGFQLCDRRPDLLQAHITIEPNGPPFFDITHTSDPTWYVQTGHLSRPWGITRRPLRYTPPVTQPSELQPVSVTPDSLEASPGWLQSPPPRRLPQLALTPVAILTAGASFRTGIDPWTTRFLTQAGVPAEHLKLVDFNMEGNGHMMMLETNSSAIATIVSNWSLQHRRSK